MFEWFRSNSRERRKKVRLDREHLEYRARRFLKDYLEADEKRKSQFYRAVEDVSRKCHPAGLGLAQSDVEDSRIAETTSATAMKMFLDRLAQVKNDDRVGNFVTDSCATVAIAYHRAAGAHVDDKEMQELGTAAVHLLTMATSYTDAKGGSVSSSQA